MKYDLPQGLNDEECDTLLENWDRFLAIETRLLSPTASKSTVIDAAVYLTLDEARWKKDLQQRKAAREDKA